MVEHSHDRDLRDSRLPRTRGSSQQNTLVAVVEHVEELRLDWVEVFIPVFLDQIHTR